MAAFGRKQPLGFQGFHLFECPLLVKADVQIAAPAKSTYEWPVYTRNQPFG